MRDVVVWNRKTGELGLKKCLGDKGFKDTNWGDGTKAWGSNYAVFILNPIFFTWKWENRVQSSADWRPLPKSDPRTQYVALFQAIYDAAWAYEGFAEDEGIVVEDAQIEDQHEVFRLIKEIFEA